MASLTLNNSYSYFHAPRESQSVYLSEMFYFCDFKKAGTLGVPNGILQNTGAELFKTHKTGSSLGKMKQTGSPKTHTCPPTPYQSRPCAGHLSNSEGNFCYCSLVLFKTTSMWNLHFSHTSPICNWSFGKS